MNATSRRYLQSSGFTNDLLIGMADGIMLPFALAAVLSLIAGDSDVVLLVCVLESVVLATVFGIAAYQTVVNQAEEYPDEETSPGGRRKGFVPHLQLQQILANLDLGTEIMEKAAEDGVNYKVRWSGLLDTYGLGQPAPDFPRARRNGLNTALSFLIGALLPLLPYIFIPAPIDALKYAAAITFIALVIFGYLKAAYTGQNPWKGALRLVITGIVVASAAFLVAYFFKV